MKRKDIYAEGNEYDCFSEFCYLASRHAEIFRTFKRNPIFREVLYYRGQQVGLRCLEYVLNNPIIKFSDDELAFLLKNDSVGDPRTVRYYLEGSGGGHIECSPTNLAYLAALVNIVELFDVDKIKTIAEIGVGCGDQCRILMSTLPLECYKLVDLPEVLALSEKFLNALDVTGDIRYIDGTHLYHDEPCDLVISVQSLNLLDKQTQDHYFDKIVSKAKAGYLIWEDVDFVNRNPQRYHGYSVEGFADKIPNAKIIPEYPVTNLPNHRIIVWGTK